MRIMRRSWYSASCSRTLNDSLLRCSLGVDTACACAWLCEFTWLCDCTCTPGVHVAGEEAEVLCSRFREGAACVCNVCCCWCSARRTFGLVLRPGLGLGDTLSLETDGTNEETVAVAVVVVVAACEGALTTTHPSLGGRFESASSERADAALTLLRALESLWRSVSEASSRLPHLKKRNTHCLLQSSNCFYERACTGIVRVYNTTVSKYSLYVVYAVEEAGVSY